MELFFLVRDLAFFIAFEFQHAGWYSALGRDRMPIANSFDLIPGN